MSNKTGTEKGYSISALARMAGVDRRTLASRLEGVTPLESGPKGKLYRLADVVRNFITQPLQADDDPELSGLRARKLAAETELAELKLRRERGEVVDYREAVADFMQVWRSIHTWLTVSMPERLSARLYKAKSAARAAELLREEAERMLAEFREERLRHLAGDEGFTEEVDDDQA